MTLAKLTRALALCLLVGLAPSALAQLRTIPADALSGTMRHLQGMLVEINGTPVMLAPGAQIRDADNRAAKTGPSIGDCSKNSRPSRRRASPHRK